MQPEADMTSIEISDEYMTEMRAKTKRYTAVLLKVTARFAEGDAWPIVWEHGRRNFALRARGILSIVCPINDDSDLAGLYIFNTDPDETSRLMTDDPGVQAGIFTFDVHPCRGFPGDALST
jgi:hypothetical protein